MAKGIKSLELSGWLVLALYSEEARHEQQLIPHAARYKLSAGLTKLSRLEAKDWPASPGDGSIPLCRQKGSFASRAKDPFNF